MDLAEIKNAYDFTNRTIVVTGGSGALGSGMVCALVGCGANVAVIDWSEERNAQLRGRLAAQHTGGSGRSMFVNADVLQRAALVDACAAIEKELGPVYGLINAAGGNHPSASTGPYAKGQGPTPSFFDLTEDGLRFVTDLNFLGTVLPSQVFAKGMVERGEGVILNISSMNSYRPLTRIPAYSAAKAAVSNFTQWLAVYMAQNHSAKIRVNAIAPGFFITEQSRFLLTVPATGELSPRGQSVVTHTPMGRFGEPDDLLGVVLWLLSPASEFVTGVVLPIDGGFAAYSGV